jgi:hypothetical protein
VRLPVAALKAESVIGPNCAAEHFTDAAWLF